MLKRKNNLFTQVSSSPIFLTILGAVLGIALYSTATSPNKAIEKCSNFFGRQIVSLSTTPLQYDASQPKDLILKSSRKLFSDMPAGHQKYFYAPCSKNCHPMIRALRTLGWDKVNTIKEGRLVFSFKQDEKLYDELQSWQRFNHIADSFAWHDLSSQIEGWKQYAKKTGKWPYFVPESYRVKEDRKALESRMKSGVKENWVATYSSGIDEEFNLIRHYSANSRELREYIKKPTLTMLQSYVCNQLTWKKRKIAIRSFWMVASMDPLIVLYQDGFARHGYLEKDLWKTTKDYSESTLPEFETQVLKPYLKKRRRLGAKNIKSQPLAHIRSQLKESIATLVDAFRDQFKPPKLAEDGFVYYATDSVLDEDLNVWLVNAYNETKLPEDHYFLLETNHHLFHGMAKVLSEIWDKQSRGLPILPLQHGDGWQLVYAADSEKKWKYEYGGHERKPKKSCRIKLANADREVDEDEEDQSLTEEKAED